MGILTVDGFDYYTTATLRWTSINFSAGTIGAYGRFSTNGLRQTNACNSGTIPLGSNCGTVYTGFAMKSSLAGPSRPGLCRFYDGATAQLIFVVNTDGTIGVYRNASANLLATSTLTVNVTAFHFFEFKCVISTTVGQITVKVDGIEFINTSANLNTQASGNSYINLLALNYSFDNWSVNQDYDDLWIADDQFYGDCRVETRMPVTPDGNYEQWTKSAGSHNFECVDEIPPATADYVSGSAANLIDTYNTDALTTTVGTIKAVQANIYCQKSNAGNKQIASIARLSATDLAGSGIAVPSSWGYLQQQLARPGGGSWSIADVNAAEFGIKLIA